MARPAKYIAVAERLQERIEAGAFPLGEPLPAEQALAAEFGVNRLTLRKALDVLSRKHAVIRRQGLGTFASPQAQAPAVPAVLYVGETGTHFYQGFYQALCGEAQDRGLAVISVRPDGDNAERQERFRRLVTQHRRLICMEAVWQQVRDVVPEEVHVTRVSGFHSVSELAADTRPGYLISSNEYEAAKLATEHLIQLGHRRIGLLDIAWEQSADPALGMMNPRRRPLLGYRSALQESGITAEWLLAIPDRPDVTDWQEHEAQSVRRHFDTWTELPTAIVSAYDFRAGPLLRVLRERGLRVPADVSVIGIGNTPWAEALDPQLTTICLGEKQMARLAIVLNAEPEPTQARVVRVDPELVVRKSTAAVTG